MRTPAPIVSVAPAVLLFSYRKLLALVEPPNSTVAVPLPLALVSCALALLKYSAWPLRLNVLPCLIARFPSRVRPALKTVSSSVVNVPPLSDSELAETVATPVPEAPTGAACNTTLSLPVPDAVKFALILMLLCAISVSVRSAELENAMAPVMEMSPF